ncbi:MAG: ATP-binding protein [Bryobacteraceae bacterium]|jgi:two-component system NarL family sensor kinase
MSETGALADAFLRQSPFCHWVVDAGGRFEHFYGDPRPLLGKPVAALVGRTAEEALEPQIADIWRDRFARAAAGETLMLLERRGEESWYIGVFPIGLPGQPPRAGASVKEISAWRAAGQDLRSRVLSALGAQEFERQMVAKFLHDKVGQNLTAVGLQLDLVRMDMECLSPDTASRVSDIQKLLEVMMQEVREYSYELNPAAVERAGLRSALDRLTTRVRGRFSGAVRVNVDPSLKLDPKVASSLYQIAQEAVENAVQHSACSVIEIAVKSTKAGLSLEVRDNGRGFDPADVLGGRRGLGILSMEHYAAQAGLDFSIRSNRETGSVVHAAGPGAE